MPHIVLATRQGVDARLSELALVDTTESAYFCESIHESERETRERAVLLNASAWLRQRVAADAGRPLVIVAFGAEAQREVLEAALARCGLSLPAGTSWSCLQHMSHARHGSVPEHAMHWLLYCSERAGVAIASHAEYCTLDHARGWAAVYAEWQEEAEREEAVRSVHEAELAQIDEARAAFAEAEMNAQQVPAVHAGYTNAESTGFVDNEFNGGATDAARDESNQRVAAVPPAECAPIAVAAAYV